MREQVSATVTTYKAITQHGEECHFGEPHFAKAWAGPNGTVVPVELKIRPELRAVSDAGSHSDELVTQSGASSEIDKRAAHYLAQIVSAYDAYRARGVMPAPNQYQALVQAIKDGKDFLFPQEKTQCAL